MDYLVVFVGAGLGGALRYGVNVGVPRLIATDFPFHTLIVNVAGCCIMGLIAEYFAIKGNLAPHWTLFLGTGVLGGFTTFSAFSLDAALLYQRGETAAAAGYVVVSVALSIAGLFGGLAIVRYLLR